VKTISLKKVAVVAVASLGFGLLSVVPAQAAMVTTIQVNSINLAKQTSTPATGAAVKFNVGVAMVAGVTAAANTDETPFIAFFNSTPTGGVVALSGAHTCADGATAASYPTAFRVASTAAAAARTYIRAADATTASDATAITASATACTVSYSFTPSKAGAYGITVYNDVDNDGVFDSNEVSQTLSITVAAAATYSNTLSTAFITYGATATAPSSTTSAAQNSVTAAKGGADGSNDNSAAIDIVIKDSSNNALATGNTMSAEISGPGYIRWVNEAVDADNCATAPSYGADLGRSLAARAVDAQSALYVCSDGTAGVATVTIKVTDVNDVVNTLATRSITFFGSVSKIVATPVLTVARVAGASATGTSVADRDLATEVPSVIVKATDAGGNAVSGLTITAKSSSTGIMSETITVTEDVLSTANIYSSGGKGNYNISVTASTGAKSGDKATLTFRVVDPAGDGTTYLTSDVAYTVGGSVATETLSFDKTSYAPGEAMVITRTAKDSSGNPVYDGAASPAVSFSKSVGGTAPAAGSYKGGVSASSTSAATAAVFAPVTPGAFSATATSGATGSPTITASASVTDANAGLLTQIDALNAKIVALNALIAKIMKKLGVK